MRRLPLILLALAALPAGASAQSATPAATPAVTQCTFTGFAGLEGVEVRPASGRSIYVHIDPQRMSISPLPRGQVRVQIFSPIELEGRVASTAVPIVLRSEQRLAGGVLRLRPGTELSRLRLGANGEATFDAQLNEEVSVRGLHLPCGALEVGSFQETSAEDPNAPTTGALQARGRSLRLRERPGGGASITLRLTPGEPLALSETGRRGGWVRVRRDFLEGSVIEGWVRASALRRTAPESFDALAMPPTSGSLGLCGRGPGMGYDGPATLVSGTEIHARSGGGSRWARVHHEIALPIVRIAPGAQWAQVDNPPGLRNADPDGCDQTFTRAWVPVSGLILPPDAQAPQGVAGNSP